MKRACPKSATNVIVLIDNQSTVEILSGRPSFLCGQKIENIRKTKKEWASSEKLAHIKIGYTFGE